MPEISNTSTTFLDCETALIAPHKQFPPIACVTINDRVHHVSEAYSVVKQALSDTIVGHGVAFDMGVIVTQWPDLWPDVFRAYDEGRIICTEVRAKLEDIATGQRKYYTDANGDRKKSTYRLADLMMRHFGRTITGKGTTQLQYGPLIETPLAWWPEEYIKYALADVNATRDLYQHQQTLPDQAPQCRAAFWIKVMSAHGVNISHDRVVAFARKEFSRYEQLTTQLKQWGWMTAKGKRSAKKVKQYIEAHYPDVPRTKTGPSTKAEFLRKTGDPYLAAYAECSELTAVVSQGGKGDRGLAMLAKALRNGGIIHSHFDSLKDNGRTGSAAPNLQNLPTSVGVRECIEARPGYALICTDYSGAELCTWAQCCYTLLGFSSLRDTINNGRDAHCELSALIMHTTYEDAVACKASEGYKPRQAAKAINFGAPGGAGIKRLRDYAESNYGVRMTFDEVKAIKRHWMTVRPEASMWFDVMKTLIDRGYLQQPMSGRIRGGAGFCDGCNTMFSGLAADMAKAAGWELLRAEMTPGNPLYQTRTVLFVHDEFVRECPVDRVHEAALEQERIMVEVAQRFCPDVHISVETTANYQYSKKAERLEDDNGRLIPWTAPSL